MLLQNIYILVTKTNTNFIPIVYLLILLFYLINLSWVQYLAKLKIKYVWPHCD